MPDYEAICQCMAELVTEGSVVMHRSGKFQFAQRGYSKYLPRIKALRTLNGTSKMDV